MTSVAENILNDAGSVLSILTFAYAIGIGLYFYLRTTASSSQEINEFIISLQFSYEEIQAFAYSYANYEKDRELNDPEAEALAAKAYLIQGHAQTRLEGLRKLALKVGTMANDSHFKRWTNRARFVLLQDELERNVAGKDRLMDELRRVQERFNKLADERHERQREAVLQQQVSLLQIVIQRLDRIDGVSTEKPAPKHRSSASIASSDTAVE